MKIGNLYEFKRYFWLLYPSKDIAVAAVSRLTTVPAAAFNTADAVADAAFLSNRFKCNVSYIKPSIFVLLDQDEKYCKILSTNGEVGWIILADWWKEDIEEVNQ
jgi:hypothetical protein